MSTVTVAATQMACTWDRDANIARAEGLVRQAASKGAQVILLQELFETPYFCKDHIARHLELALPLDGHPAVEHFSKVARELGVVLPISVFERANNAFYNSVAVVDADRPTNQHGTPPALLECELRAVGYAPVRHVSMPSAGGYLALFKVEGPRPAPGTIRPCDAAGRGL